jgi:hypothetical protein
LNTDNTDNTDTKCNADAKIKIKRKINWWLEDHDFLSRSNFPDLYYFETVCKHISNMVKNLPIPVLTTYDSKNKSIYFSVGKIKNSFLLNTDISYSDYITLIKRGLYQFFPRYEIIYDKEEEYSEEELWEIVRKDKINLNDALLLRKTSKVKEIGIIEKITMLRDEFILSINGDKQVRISGSTYMPMSLSIFMDKLKVLEKNEDKYNFIFSNSAMVKYLHEDNRDINIVYPGKQMIHFFDINFEDLKNFELVPIDNFNYRWGKFKITFESLTLKNDCIALYTKKMEKDS